MQQAKKYKTLQDDLMSNIGSIGVVLMGIGQARGNPALLADGQVVLVHTEPLSERLTNLSKQYESVYKVLRTLCDGTVISAVLAEVGAIVMAIAANHGVGIPGLPGAAPAPNIAPAAQPQMVPVDLSTFIPMNGA